MTIIPGFIGANPTWRSIALSHTLAIRMAGHSPVADTYWQLIHSRPVWQNEKMLESFVEDIVAAAANGG